MVYRSSLAVQDSTPADRLPSPRARERERQRERERNRERDREREREKNKRLWIQGLGVEISGYGFGVNILLARRGIYAAVHMMDASGGPLFFEGGLGSRVAVFSIKVYVRGSGFRVKVFILIRGLGFGLEGFGFGVEV